ncbi:MAG: hypothetical protein HQ515_20685 [Phycisphaeraceae bacterium]|nr:hypothetical protein [Phycisphaeraceae bacterium]
MLLKKIIAICLLPYAVWLVLFYRYHFLDGANLLIHEAGHMVFLPLGLTLHIIGGTLWQLVFPAVVAGYFWRRRQRYESAVGCLWLGESLMYTAVYVGDAMAMILPRVGGPIHDWNWLLHRVGLLGQCQTIAWGLHGIASAVVLLSILYMLLDVFGLSGLVNPHPLSCLGQPNQ